MPTQGIRSSLGSSHRLIQDQPVAQCPILEEAAQARHFTERLSGAFNTPAGWRKKGGGEEDSGIWAEKGMRDESKKL